MYVLMMKKFEGLRIESLISFYRIMRKIICILIWLPTTIRMLNASNEFKRWTSIDEILVLKPIFRPFGVQ